MTVSKGETKDMEHQHALAELIDEARRVNGWSDQDIVNRAVAAGHKISKANISRVRNSDVVAVNISFVYAMAAGMGVRPFIVARAALASAGITVGVDRTSIEDAIDMDMTLTLENRRTLRLMVKAMKGKCNDPDRSQKTTDGGGGDVEPEKTDDDETETDTEKTDENDRTIPTQKKTNHDGGGVTHVLDSLVMAMYDYE